MEKSYRYIVVLSLFFAIGYSSIGAMEWFSGAARFLCKHKDTAVSLAYTAYSKNTLIGAALASCGGFLGYKWLSHSRKLDEIERVIAESKVLSRTENNASVFKFATWRTEGFCFMSEETGDEVVHIFNIKDPSSYQTMFDLLKSDIKIYFKEKLAFKQNPIIDKIDAELQQWEEWLEYVSSLTDMPQRIVQCIGNEAQERKSLKQPLFITDFRYLKTIAQSARFWEIADGLLSDKVLLVQEKNPSQVKDNLLQRILNAGCSGFSFLKKSLIYMPSWWRVWKWQLMPCYERASKLYLEIYAYYVRLHILRDLLVKADFPKKETGKNSDSEEDKEDLC